MSELIKAMPVIFVLLPAAMAAVLIYISIIQPKEGKKLKKNTETYFYIGIILIIGLGVRIIASVLNYGHEHSTDMNDFSAWADMLFKNGIGSFYSSDSLTDYPPGYMYILWFFGMLKHVTGLGNNIFFTLLKLPAMLCDMGIAFIIYKLARKRFSCSIASAVSALYVFSPAAITDCALWGQVDSVYTLLIAAMLYCIYDKKYIPSYFLFAAAILVKLQSLMIAPILIFAVAEDFFVHDFDRKKVLKNLAYGLCAIACMFIVSLPFGIRGVITQYGATLSSYPYMTVNAFNLWNFLGQNWVGIDCLNDIWSLFGITSSMPDFASVIGWLFIAAAVTVCGIVFFRSAQRGKIFCLGAFLFLSSYMLSTRMHERYSFCALALLLMAYCVIPDRRTMFTYLANTMFQFFAYAWILYVYETDINTYAFCSTQKVLSAINIVLYAAFIFSLYKSLAPVPLRNRTRQLIDDERCYTLTKKDKKAAAVITAVYSVIALSFLGSFSAPETVYELGSSPMQVTFSENTGIEKIALYLGPSHLHKDCRLGITLKDEHGTSVYSEELASGSVFFWNYYDVGQTVRSAEIYAPDDKLYIMTLSFIGYDGKPVIPENADEYSAVFDEQELVPDDSTFMNSTYFDEIYHARTAYEFIHGQPVYEWTHPPLGKIFISLGVLIFGMCPFGWRIAGTLFGIVMVPVVYAFVKRLFGKSWLSVCGCILYTFDFMHFTQTRIATIDVYVTFFIILMYMYMYKFYMSEFWDKPLGQTLKPLALCGLFFGLGAASKWTALYAGAGLAVIWLTAMLRHTAVFKAARKNPGGDTDGISNTFICENFIPRAVKTIMWCVVFFIAVPAVIYVLSYIPYMHSSGSFSLKTIINNQVSMLTYHAKTVVNSTHPYSSRWYQWIIMVRPIWYYSHTYSSTVKAGISAFGNPLVWWVGIAALLVNIYMIAKERDKKALFLVIGYFAQIIPWIPVTRTTYIYHYFPAVLFLVLMICSAAMYLYTLSRDKNRFIKGVYVYTCTAVLLFVMFYPVLSGVPVMESYVKTFLKWFSTWVLI